MHKNESLLAFHFVLCSVCTIFACREDRRHLDNKNERLWVFLFVLYSVCTILAFLMSTEIKMIKNIFTFLLFVLLAVHVAVAQTDEALPTANPTMTYVDADGQEVDETQYDGSAPFHASFKANVEHVGSYTPLYEWRFTRSGQSEPYLVRYDEDTECDFNQSGSYSIELRVSFVLGTDTIAYAMDEPFSVTISESKLEVPNAFTPNGDGVNDVFRVKDGYQSIVQFHAAVFDRWGKKLYEWSDPAEGWDGRSGGHDVPDGAYYLNLQARGADGRKYNIKKVINLLRGYLENGSQTVQ